ncbi:MAG TPA: HAD-IIA family hydrolase [Acidimicrobiia bacterium]
MTGFDLDASSEVVAPWGDVGNVGAIVIDLDGVVYVDDREVPGAGEALGRLAGAYRLVFATNNSTKTAETVAANIEASTGFPARPEQVATSGQATALAMAGSFSSAFVVGEQGLVDTLTAGGMAVTADWRAADAVVVGLDRSLSYQKLADAARAVRAGAAFYATNTDATYPMPDGLYPGGGAISAAIETASGGTPIVCGKPHDEMRALIASRVGEGDVIVLGDRPETDVALGKAAGWITVLTLTGVVSDLAQVPPELRPDHVISSIAELPDRLARRP